MIGANGKRVKGFWGPKVWSGLSVRQTLGSASNQYTFLLCWTDSAKTGSVWGSWQSHLPSLSSACRKPKELSAFGEMLPLLKNNLKWIRLWEKLPLAVVVSLCCKSTLTLECEFDGVLCYSNSGKQDRGANILLTKGSRRISALRKTTLIFFVKADISTWLLWLLYDNGLQRGPLKWVYA